MVAFVSSVAGGLAATGWFLFRASTSAAPSSAQSSQMNPERMPNPFGDSSLNAATSDRHPSWSSSRGVTHSNSNDRDGDSSDSGRLDGVHVKGGWKGNGGVESTSSPKGKCESAQQYGISGVDDDRFGEGDGEREAGVWVGWGGGCAF